MARLFFEEDTNSSPGEKLFATEYLAKNKKELGKHFTIQEITLAKSNKGYMLHTDYFVCWLWKNSKLTKMLLEALREYVETGKGYYLFVELTNANKDCFSIGMDSEISSKWYDMGNDCYSSTPRSTSSTESENPFLPHALSPLMETIQVEPPLETIPLRTRKRA